MVFRYALVAYGAVHNAVFGGMDKGLSEELRREQEMLVTRQAKGAPKDEYLRVALGLDDGDETFGSGGGGLYVPGHFAVHRLRRGEIVVIIRGAELAQCFGTAFKPCC